MAILGKVLGRVGPGNALAPPDGASYIPAVSRTPLNAPRILAVRFSAIGDILLTTPLLRALRLRYPEAYITYVTKTEFVPLLENNPRLNRIIAYSPGGSIRSLAREIRADGFTHQLDLHGSVRSRILRWLAGGRWTGYPKYRRARAALIRSKQNRYPDQRSVAERYFDAARRLDVIPDEGSTELFLRQDAMTAADAFLRKHDLGQERTLLAVAPGAAHQTKRWPIRHWQDLVAKLTQNGADVVVVGGPEDGALGRTIAEVAGAHAVSAAGVFDLQGSAALIKRARSLTAGDTAATHLATAVGTPVVSLFGPTVPAFGFGPYHARATILQHELPCRPCSPMGTDRCPLGHHKCLEDLRPDEVLNALRRLPQ